MEELTTKEKIRRIKKKIETTKLRFRYHSIQMDYFDKKYITLRKELVELQNGKAK